MQVPEKSSANFTGPSVLWVTPRIREFARGYVVFDPAARMLFAAERWRRMTSEGMADAPKCRLDSLEYLRWWRAYTRAEDPHTSIKSL